MTAYTIARIACAVFTLYIPAVAFLQPLSGPGIFRAVDAVYSLLLFGIMCITAFAMLADVICNFMLRGRHCWAWALDKREWFYMIAAFCSLASNFTAAKYGLMDGPAIGINLAIYTGLFFMALCDAYEGFNRAQACRL